MYSISRTIATIGFCLFILNATAQHKFTLSAGPALTINNIKWSIAGNASGTSPNVYSELDYKKITGAGGYASAAYSLNNGLFISADYLYSKTVKGKATDTDYGSDNRTNPINGSPLYLNSNNGSHQSIHSIIGYKFFKKNYISLTAGAGYYYEKTLLNTSRTNNNTINSDYNYTWAGPQLGLGLGYNNNKFSGELAVQAASLQYKSTANWMEITTLQHPVSFRQSAKGIGISPLLQASYQVLPHLSVFTKMDYDYFSTKKGVDAAYLSTGNTAYTQFNQAKQKTFTTTVGVSVSLK